MPWSARFSLLTGTDPPTLEDIEDLDYMEGVVSFPELESDQIGVVLSARHAWTWTGGEVLQGRPDQPITVDTLFGWTLLGPGLDDVEDDVAVNFCAVENESLPLQDEIHQLF